jgi:hypothetical protein
MLFMVLEDMHAMVSDVLFSPTVKSGMLRRIMKFVVISITFLYGD